YWGGLGMAGMGMGMTGMGTGMPLETAIATTVKENEDSSTKAEETADPHLRSAQKVLTYKTMAIDGEIGSVDDFIVDDAAWKINFLILDIGKWLFGKKVLISPEWIKSISWDSSVVIVDSTMNKINNSMEYDPKKPLNEAFEKNLYDYHGRLVSYGK
ncbi:MAG: PRC-barrel domain containing protein, partial [Sphingobacteriaceae bacterium]